MSLKGFHILFVTLATLFCAFITTWAFTLEPTGDDSMIKIIGRACGLGMIILPVYGVLFYSKIKKLSAQL
ncbi:hypothetical protein [Persicirhabdus sediminis]|uniref:Uncharacterized protein n=1 Tax=Persicirhabdus sediminis TaxID=454144 RepID=A0A8J7MC45_9BACT|nr:hypothetical protein [Persicirhabdus sediminis]MBK1790392.1 hypothetical protein [Persicirhabdus sediminis]